MISRRTLLAGGAALTGAALTGTTLFPRLAGAQTVFAPQPGAWRNFQVVTRLEVVKPSGAAKAWVPLPAFSEADWFKPAGSTWTTNAASAKAVGDARYDGQMLELDWAASEANPVVEITSKFATRDRAVDLSKPGAAATLAEKDRAYYTASTDFIPTGGIVKETSDKITAGLSGDLEKTRAIYQWVVENTYRNASTRGCGTGDVASLLKSGNLGGKCADLNALFVGLVRAQGIPARDIYGVRVAPSKFGYKSLGANSEVVTKAQHCRSEVYLSGFGWVPTDPADVRKVILEEPPGKLAIDDAKVAAARAALFGSWEGNWMAYNTGHDISLPGSSGPKLAFLMYPQAETVAGRLDCLDPDTFRYTIRATEISV